LVDIKLNCVDYTSSHHPGVESNKLYAEDIKEKIKEKYESTG